MVEKTKNLLANQNLTRRYTLASLVIILLAMIGIGWWVNRQISTGVIHRTSATTALFVESFIASHLQELGRSGELTQGNVKLLDQLISNTSLGKQIVAFKVWNTSGVVQFSTDKSTVGKTYPIEDGLAQALNGEVASRISNLEQAENIPEQVFGKRLIETYIPVRLAGTDRIIAVAEFYQKVDELQSEIVAAQIRSWLVVGGVMALIFVLLSGFVKRASDTIDQQKVELSNQVRRLTELLEQNQELHERVRRAAARVTTLNERILRRIGAELHDGPAQDLSLALLNLDTIIGQSEVCQAASANGILCNSQIIAVQSATQNALKELRAISTGLGLPELAGLSLTDTIMRVVHAHERRTNTKVDLELGEIPDQSQLPIKITLYRLIQEALNNAYHHADGKGQKVSVNAKDGQIIVTISDEGPGFDLSQASRLDSHLGIAGMRERVESLGGKFVIVSGHEQGTKVSAYFNLHPEGIKDER